MHPLTHPQTWPRLTANSFRFSHENHIWLQDVRRFYLFPVNKCYQSNRSGNRKPATVLPLPGERSNNVDCNRKTSPVFKMGYPGLMMMKREIKISTSFANHHNDISVFSCIIWYLELTPTSISLMFEDTSIFMVKCLDGQSIQWNKLPNH